MRATTWPGFAAAALVACAQPKWSPAPLPPAMAPWVGCYAIDVAWHAPADRREQWRLLLGPKTLVPYDSSDSTPRPWRAILLLPRGENYLAQFGTWEVERDSMRMIVVLGREGQGYSVSLTRQEREVVGSARLVAGGFNRNLQTVDQADVGGQRTECRDDERKLETAAP